MTLREVLINESLNPKMDKILGRFEKKPVPTEFISAGTGKEIARTGFEKYTTFPEGYSIQLVRTTDGNYDVYFAEKETKGDPYRCKDCYVGSIDKEVNRFQAWHDACVMCYKSDRVPKEYKQLIKKAVNSSFNMDRYDRDVNYKEID